MGVLVLVPVRRCGGRREGSPRDCVPLHDETRPSQSLWSQATASRQHVTRVVRKVVGWMWLVTQSSSNSQSLVTMNILDASAWFRMQECQPAACANAWLKS
jgi:hypothetical protein